MKTKLATATVIVMAIGSLVGSSGVANATVKKTIICYKATASKKVIAVKPVCPKGWSTKKPVIKPTPKPTTSTKSTTINFAGSYKGKMSVLWSDSDVQVSSVSASGTGNTASLATLTGSGSSQPQSQCDSINGTGVLSDGTNTVNVRFDTTAKGCADDGSAPTVVHITGNAVITGGTGKYVGATGTLKAVGSFAIKSKDAGFSETTALTLNLNGNIVTK